MVFSVRNAEIQHALDDVPSGTHACILYDTWDQLLAVVVPFLRSGLERNERCLYLGAPEVLDVFASALRTDGVDVEDAVRRGALHLVSERDYPFDAAFDPDFMVENLCQAIDRATADGFTGLRATGDLSWELGPNPNFGVISAYEAKLDDALRGRAITGLCQFRRRDYPPEVLRTALRTHEAVTLDDKIIPHNPFHEPSCLLVAGDCRATESARLEWMTATLRETAEIELRRKNEVRSLREEHSRETRDRLARVLEEMSDAFIAVDLDWRITYANAEALRISGLRSDDFIGRMIWDVCHEGTGGIIARECQRAVAEQTAIRIEHCLVLEGREKWLDINAYPSPEGINIFYRDISERKQAEQRQCLLMREVDHRAKNALAVAQSIVMLTQAETMPAFVAAVEGRIAALARVHTLLAMEKWSGADLGTIVSTELEPYSHGTTGCVSIDGPAVSVVADAAQPIAMILHELATNAAKYGALSVSEGRVAVNWSILPDGRLSLHWVEHGGPAVLEPKRHGFGSHMIALAVSGQLDGRVDSDWHPDGLRCTISIAADRMTEGSAHARENVSANSHLPSVRLEGRRVLLVEDDSMLALGMQAAMRDLGCQVVGPAATLDTALRLAASEKLDAAILDVNLRGRESWTVADILVERGIPHIFTTGYGDAGPRVAERGARILLKPFHPDQLAPTLRQALSSAGATFDRATG